MVCICGTNLSEFLSFDEARDRMRGIRRDLWGISGDKTCVAHGIIARPRVRRVSAARPFVGDIFGKGGVSFG